MNERDRKTVRLSAWAVGVHAGLTAAGAFLEQHRGASLAIQTFAAEWATGRLGVTWSDPHEPPPPGRVIVRRLGVGALLGAGVAIVTFAVAFATHAATIARTTFSVSGLVAGVLFSTLLAVRDELVLRGLVLQAFRHSLPPVAQLLLCGAVAAAAQAGASSDVPVTALFASWVNVAPLALAALTGAGYAALWQEERGAFMAIGANTAWTAGTTTLLAACGWDARWSSSVWGGRGGGLSSSLAVISTVALLMAVAFIARVHAARKIGVASGNDRAG